MSDFILMLIICGLLFIFVVRPVLMWFYFRSEQFLALKASLQQYVNKCNELNDHIEHLKQSYKDMESFDYGEGRLIDASSYNMQRSKWATQDRSRRTYQCSASVVKNANDKPFKYLCKYFNIKANEKTLENLELALNNFYAAEQGKNLLIRERDEIISDVIESIPKWVWWRNEDKVRSQLGFTPVDLSHLHFPIYTFEYISAGGNSSSKCVREV